MNLINLTQPLCGLNCASSFLSSFSKNHSEETRKTFRVFTKPHYKLSYFLLFNMFFAFRNSVFSSISLYYFQFSKFQVSVRLLLLCFRQKRFSIYFLSYHKRQTAFCQFKVCIHMYYFFSISCFNSDIS